MPSSPPAISQVALLFAGLTRTLCKADPSPTKTCADLSCCFCAADQMVKICQNIFTNQKFWSFQAFFITNFSWCDVLNLFSQYCQVTNQSFHYRCLRSTAWPRSNEAACGSEALHSWEFVCAQKSCSVSTVSTNKYGSCQPAKCRENSKISLWISI